MATTMAEKTRQQIEKDSQGIQAARDVNIFLPDKSLLPVLEKMQHDIDEVKVTVNSLLESERKKNAKFHITNVLKKLRGGGNRPQTSPPSSNSGMVEKLKLFQEWVEGVSDVDPSENLLSEIWEEWLRELNRGGNSTELKTVIEVMKKLESAHGNLLLKIRDGHGAYQSGSAKELFYLEQLEQLRVVESRKGSRQRQMELSIRILGVFTGLILIFFLSVIGAIELISAETFIIIVTTVILGVVFTNYVPSMLHDKKYHLTWIGKKIVSFAANYKAQ